MSDEEVEALEQARKDAETDTLWLAAHLEICKGCDRCQIGSFFGAESYSVNDVYASERGTK